MTTIWSYGYINLDIITRTVAHWPEKGGVIWVDDVDFEMGGVALNPAVTVAKLGGLPVGLIGYIGDDLAGQMVRRRLDSLGVDTTYLTTVNGQPTGVCIVTVHPDTERSFIISPGANARLYSAGVRLEGLTPGDIFHVGGAINLLGLSSMLEQIRRREVLVSVDVSFDSSGQWWSRLAPLLPFIDIFMANASETNYLTGTTDPAQAGRRVAAEGPRFVVVKLGAEGAYLFAPTWEGHVPPFKVEAVDTTGAGDAFAGALLYGLTKGWPVEQAAIFANAVGALCVTRAGATSGVGSYAETVTFMRRHGRLGDWAWATSA